MKNNIDLIEKNVLEEKSERKAYSTPKLHRYGGLAELVQATPDRGVDGETRFPDCTS